ncbi:MAG: Asp-tRNA(Asn)/Glu-tRNA(Gln) amidotransferase subunit GatA [Planctomycetota bacterium]
MDPTTTCLITLRDAIADRKASATDVLDAYLARIDRHNTALNAYRELIIDQAKQRAAAVDAGEVTGRLAGVPIAIKDCMCHTQGTTACSSRILEHYRSPFTATVVTKLEAEGAVVLGKTNMDEFAMGSSTENSAFGTSKNPWDTSRVPGGSSGGSSAAMAADLAAATLGSDTGGSIRQPASITGTVGFKPTYGRNSRWGLVAFASSLDQIGTFTRTLADTALLSQIMFGKDPRDSTSAAIDVPQDLHDIDADLGQGPLRIGIAKQYLDESANHPAVTKAFNEALDIYKKLGAQIVEVDLPHTEYGIPCYYIVATAEASSNLARYDGVHYGHRTTEPTPEGENAIQHLMSQSRAEGFGNEVKRRIMLGTYALSSGYYDAYYNRALKVRRLIAGDFETAFQHCDTILCPTTTGPAFKIGEKADDPLAMYMNDIYTVTANLAGIPAVSVPGGFAEEDGRQLPIGMQFIGKAFDEKRLLRIARLYERETNFGQQRPTMDPFAEQRYWSPPNGL